MRKTVLIVEDDDRISKLIHDCFVDNYNVIIAANGAQALIDFGNNRVDMVLLDIMLPIIDGWEVCKRIREQSSVPIIMLTAKTEEYSKLKGFRMGVDDYVTKPFSPKVLLAKSAALLKRIEDNIKTNKNIYEIDQEFIINEPSHKVMLSGESINLSVTEFMLLLYLFNNTGKVLTRDMILDHVWGENYYGDFRIVDTNIKRLREKLLLKADYIKTVRGIGYKFEVD